MAALSTGTARFDPNTYEIRFGVLAHGIGGVERGSADFSPELVFPHSPLSEGKSWRKFLPRLHLGALLNLQGRTSSVYAGGLWHVPLGERAFAEIFIDGAAHNGYTTAAPPGRAILGCRFLFHAGGSAGYRLSEHWILMLAFDHESNGHSLFDIVCAGRGQNTHNQGLNDWGARIGYAF